MKDQQDLGFIIISRAKYQNKKKVIKRLQSFILKQIINKNNNKMMIIITNNYVKNLKSTAALTFPE
jgi:hypothetical protein